GEPGIEHVLIAPNAEFLRRLVGAETDQSQALVEVGDGHHLALIVLAGLCQRLGLAFGDESLRLGDRDLVAVERPAVPGGNLVAPEQLARDAPGWMFSIQL